MSLFTTIFPKRKKEDRAGELIQEKEALEEKDRENKRRIAEIETKATDLQKSYDQLTTDYSELKKQLDTEEPYDKVVSEREELKRTNSRSTARIEELQSQKVELNGEIRDLKSENATLKEETESKVNDFESIIQTKTANMEDLIREKEELEMKLQSLETENKEFMDELGNIREDFDKVKQEKSSLDVALKSESQQMQEELTSSKSFLHETKVELSTLKKTFDALTLENEALKSENEGLFKSNGAKTKELDEARSEISELKDNIQKERKKYLDLKTQWDEDVRRRENTTTEFVMVSKSARQRTKSRYSKSGMEGDSDSEEEHIISLVESTRSENRTLREKENTYMRRIKDLENDKEDLFKSGSNLYTENKELKAKYEELVAERQTLLHNDEVQRRKISVFDREVKDLKKSVDDLYQQNRTIRTKEMQDQKRNAESVVMGNEVIKQLEREKSALYRRVKYLEKENTEIEHRVEDLERQSKDLIDYSQKYDKHTVFPAVESNAGEGLPHPSSMGPSYADRMMQVPPGLQGYRSAPLRNTPDAFTRTNSYGGVAGAVSPSVASRYSLPLIRNGQGRQSVPTYYMQTRYSASPMSMRK